MRAVGVWSRPVSPQSLLLVRGALYCGADASGRTEMTLSGGTDTGMDVLIAAAGLAAASAAVVAPSAAVCGDGPWVARNLMMPSDASTSSVMPRGAAQIHAPGAGSSEGWPFQGAMPTRDVRPSGCATHAQSWVLLGAQAMT
ncbi:hypothetical protein D3C86_1245900 [compost metagenome]